MTKEEKVNQTTSTTFSMINENFTILNIAKAYYRQSGHKNTIIYLLRQQIPLLQKFVEEQKTTTQLLRVINEEQIKDFETLYKKYSENNKT